jgi:hypothetical protein
VALFTWIKPFKDNEETLFHLNNFRKVGFAYYAYVTPRNYFFLISLGRRFIFGALVGFLSSLSLAQLLVCAAIEAIYIAFVARMRPHLDVTHFFAETVCAATNILVLFLAIAFLPTVPIGSQGKIIVVAFMTAMLLLSQIVCVATYILSWLHIYRVFSLRVFLVFF